jgi:molecular chaperone IbpA
MVNSISISTAGNTNYLTTGTTLSNTVWTNTFPTVTYGGTDLSKAFIGWDEQIKDLEKIGERMLKNTGNFPPYNIIKENDNTYLVEFAVAGFSKKDVKVTQEKNALIIEGNIEEDDKIEYVHKGIATRSFTRTFALAEHVEITAATYADGILTVTLVRNIPKEDQPKKITIK